MQRSPNKKIIHTDCIYLQETLNSSNKYEDDGGGEAEWLAGVSVP